ncbi:hypothetical protein HanRHA438_Chr08g0341381 [Helianthus annuus]|nr:hypothetical protein HanHA89_Chr08g0289811 [Helianthus annuus]KAJ0897052.1 hypothetical protein HanRHA438_Chr08g0341381 [Helianthus annuus]
MCRGGATDRKFVGYPPHSWRLLMVVDVDGWRLKVSRWSTNKQKD